KRRRLNREGCADGMGNLRNDRKLAAILPFFNTLLHTPLYSRVLKRRRDMPISVNGRIICSPQEHLLALVMDRYLRNQCRPEMSFSRALVINVSLRFAARA